jgi:hypothetical protein
MTKKSLVKYTENEYDKALVVNGSVLGLLDQLIELDGQKPYLELSSDKEIKSYFEKKGIDNVTDKEGLKSFYNYLENKVAELSESSDERVKLYFEKREYLKQLEAIPSNLSNLEKTISNGFEKLEIPFKAVMNYVWDAVINHGFKMEEKGKNALEKYEGELKIDKISVDNNPLVNIYYNLSEKFSFNLNIRKEKITEKDSTEIKKKFLFFKKVEPIKIKKIKKAKEGDFLYFDRGNGIPWNYISGDSIEEYIDYFKKHFLEKDEDTQQKYCATIKMVLNLPIIMDNYVKRKQQNLTKMFNEINGR